MNDKNAEKLSVRKRADAWWGSYLKPIPHNLQFRGIMRKCRDPFKMVADWRVRKLLADLESARDSDVKRLCLIIPILAQVETNNKTSLARQSRSSGIKPRQMDRVIKLPDGSAAATRIRTMSLVPRVGKSCDVGKLAADLLFWDWDESVRFRWLTDFYALDPALGRNEPDEKRG